MLRYLLPRRKENLLNVCIFILIVGGGLYLYVSVALPPITHNGARVECFFEACYACLYVNAQR